MQDDLELLAPSAATVCTVTSTMTAPRTDHTLATYWEWKVSLDSGFSGESQKWVKGTNQNETIDRNTIKVTEGAF